MSIIFNILNRYDIREMGEVTQIQGIGFYLEESELLLHLNNGNIYKYRLNDILQYNWEANDSNSKIIDLKYILPVSDIDGVTEKFEFNIFYRDPLYDLIRHPTFQETKVKSLIGVDELIINHEIHII